FRGYTTDDLVPKGQGALTLGATHITSDGKVNLETPVFISWEKYYESPEIMVQTGDLLIVQRGSTCGKVGLIENDIGPTTINPSLVLIKNIKSSSGYLLYYLQGALNDILNLVSSTAIPMLSQTQIGNIIIALPPHSEQYSILSHIRKETGIVDETIERIKAEITLIQEYKTTLIAEAVTGKIDVRDWQPEENADIPENLKTVMS
ncbi:MAG: restriction endonuclease subunit S, partial [Bacteroidota bacterium]